MANIVAEASESSTEMVSCIIFAIKTDSVILTQPTTNGRGGWVTQRKYSSPLAKFSCGFGI